MTAPRTLALALLLALGAVVSPAVAQEPEAAEVQVVARAATRADTAAVATPFDASPTHARLAAGRAWPRGRITYVDRTKDPAAVRAAVRMWNRSGLDVTFAKVASERQAALVIRNSRRVPDGCGTGLATLGYIQGRQAFVNILHGGDADGQPCAWPGQTLVLTHELGHVLGLDHDDSRCSIMNSFHVNGVAPGHCFTADQSDFDEAPGRWRCRGPEATDLRRVRRLYGGTPQVREQEWCDLVPPMPAAGPLTATPTGSWGGVTLTLRHEPEPALPSYLVASALPPLFELHVTGDCSAVAGDLATIVARGPWTVPAGLDEPLTDAGLPGARCYQLYAIDALGRHSVAPSPPVVVVAP